MNLLGTTVRAVIRRPALLVVPGVVMLLVSAFNIYLPVLSLAAGIVGAADANIFEGVVALVQFMIYPEVAFLFIFAVLCLCILFSVAAGILLPWYFSMADSAVTGGKKIRCSFKDSLKKHFAVFFVISLKVSVFFVAYFIFILIACVPAFIITRAASSGDLGLILSSLIVDVITLGVVFFSLMLSRAYIIYWYPSALKKIKRPFRAGKQLADMNFWHIVSRLVVFDIVFILYVYVVLTTSQPFLKFIAGWIPGVLYIVFFAVFIFKSYNEHLARVAGSRD
jgi:hypothetical protein